MAFGCCMDIGFVRNGEKYKGKEEEGEKDEMVR